MEFERADALHWSPGPVGFDVVFMSFWLSHVPGPLLDRCLARAADWLSPGGCLIVIDETGREVDGG